MKKSNTLPVALGVILGAFIAVLAALSLPAIKTMMEGDTRQAEPPPSPSPSPPPPAGTVEEAIAQPPPQKSTAPARPKPAKEPKPGPPPPEKAEPANPPPPAKEPDPRDADLEAKVAALHPLPKIPPLEEIVENWRHVPERAFPKMVTVDQPLNFQLFHEGRAIGGRKVPAGAHVVPIELKGSILVVAPDIQTGMRAEIPVDHTNFKEVIHERYDEFVLRQTQHVMERRASELARIRKTVAREAALADYNDGSDARFDPMKESLRKGEAEAFELENATQWRWLGPETIDGVAYEVGLAAFETESAFGVARTEIKALMRGGRVEKWVDPDSGEEL